MPPNSRHCSRLKVDKFFLFFFFFFFWGILYQCIVLFFPFDSSDDGALNGRIHHRHTERKSLPIHPHADQTRHKSHSAPLLHITKSQGKSLNSSGLRYFWRLCTQIFSLAIADNKKDPTSFFLNFNQNSWTERRKRM